MDIILAVDKNWGIGKDGQLLASIPEDLERFKRITKGHVVVMGRKTFDSLPVKPLPDRHNVVITSHGNDLPDGIFSYPSVEAFIGDLNQFILNNFTLGWFPNVYVIGGASIVEQLMPYCQSALITKIDEEFEADTHILNLDESEEWVHSIVSGELHHEDLTFTYNLYKKA